MRIALNVSGCFEHALCRAQIQRPLQRAPLEQHNGMDPSEVNAHRYDRSGLAYAYVLHIVVMLETRMLTASV